MSDRPQLNYFTHPAYLRLDVKAGVLQWLTLALGTDAGAGHALTVGDAG